MITANQARSITPSAADIKFAKDLATNERIIRGTAAAGISQATIYDGGDSPRMIAALRSVGYTAWQPTSGCLRASW